MQRDPKLGKSKVPSLKLCGSDRQGICGNEKLKPNKKSSKCYHQEQIKWSGNFVFDEIITIIPGTKYTAQGN
jgi:hypothetical protein